ncbi:AAA family ATPase [Pedobacter sp. AW31-3R]|uniref:AAA family ATPase n=1 Tax=Pedobacter sp. AW31-3R TaxID=3445781 RepID=UPI003F9F7103
MTQKIDSKIEEAQNILEDLGLKKQYHNRICALTLLALSKIKPDDSWQDATKSNQIISKDIIEFVNKEYLADYQPNTRESFRKNALKPFVDFNIALLNPDNPSLSQTSSKTHYALSDLALETILSYNTDNWELAVKKFKLEQFPENSTDGILLSTINISSYKSILNDKIELGRFNVFIGENGSGKSNILESLAAIGAVKTDDFTYDGLSSRGVRFARPDLMLSSFLSSKQEDSIKISLEFNTKNLTKLFESTIYPANKSDIYTRWIDENKYPLEGINNDLIKSKIRQIIDEINNKADDLSVDSVLNKLFEPSGSVTADNSFDPYQKMLTEYAIFDLNTRSLRGITPSESRKTPLGLNGEGLDLLISSFNAYERDFLTQCEEFFKWLDEIITDKDDKNKGLGLKPGRSTSTLYFTDRFMLKKNNILSAENSNEGILHVLFYLALFISTKTPKLFAIDNIETALNPRLCQRLVMELAKLSKLRDKQVLITTHNPAVLDGLNLFDDSQRLFVVSRNGSGHTVTRRVRFKEDFKDKPFKISEMWMRGSLGGIPNNF